MTNTPHLESERVMNRNIITLSKAFAIATGLSALSAVTLVSSTADAQWAPPPPEFMVSTEPVYYEGHPAYYYGNHWFWRDGHGAWNHYEHEPPFLAERRMHHPPVRRSWQHRR